MGSVLNPGGIGGKKSEKEMAPPNVKVAATLNTRFTQGEKEIKEENKKVPAKHEIFDEKDVKTFLPPKNETRPAPEFEILHKQKVGPSDVYLGLSDLDPSSTQCQEIVVKVKLLLKPLMCLKGVLNETLVYLKKVRQNE